MHVFDVLGDRVRRRILELLADGERAAGDLGGVVQVEFGITQPAVSQHLRVLRDHGFAQVRIEGTRRVYTVGAAPFEEVDAWLQRYRGFWTRRLDDLAIELQRGRASTPPPSNSPSISNSRATTSRSLRAPRKVRS